MIGGINSRRISPRAATASPRLLNAGSIGLRNFLPNGAHGLADVGSDQCAGVEVEVDLIRVLT
jgi:hypothetical protein